MYEPVVRPIRSQFERQLKAIQDDVLRMGALVEHSCWLAYQSLFEQDLSAVDHLKWQEQQIDSHYRQIEVNCLQLLALQSPVANDLRLIGALMQLVRDLERIGDYAEELGKLSIKLLPYPQLPFKEDLQTMFGTCRTMLALSLGALTDLDAEKGLQVKQKDDEVDDLYDKLYAALAAEQDLVGSFEPFLIVTLAIRGLERMADHATNIGRRVSFIVTGQR